MSASSMKLAEVYFEKFSTTTVIRVFNFIRTSAYPVERLFWIAVLVGFWIGTIISVTNTIKIFISEPTASQVAFLNNETEGMNFSDTVMCLELRVDALLKMYENKTDDVIVNALSSPNFMEILRRKLDSVHAIEEQRIASLQSFMQATNASNFTNEMNIRLRSFTQFKQSNFDVFNETEVALVAVTTVMLLKLIDVELNPVWTLSTGLSPSIERLRRAYVEKGTNFIELLALTAELTCVLLQVRLVANYPAPYTGVTSYTIYNFCARFSSPPFYLGIGKDRSQGWLCYRLSKGPDFPIIMRTALDSIFITLNREAIYKDPSLDQLITLEFGGKLFSMQTQPLTFNAKQSVDVILDTVTVSANLRRRGCLEKEKGPSNQCAMWCRLEAIIWGCNCMPVVRGFVRNFVSLPERLQSCATLRVFSEPAKVTDDDQCKQTLSVTEYYGAQNCSQKCYGTDCETIFINTDVFRNDPRLDSVNASTAIRLVASDFIYQKVVEYVTMDSKGFIAALGSNLSLYLGASFLALIHIVVFFVRLPFDLVHEQREKQIKSKEQAEQHGALAPISGDANLLRTLVDDFSNLRKQMEAFDRRLQRVEGGRRRPDRNRTLV